MEHDLQRNELAEIVAAEEQLWVREVWSIEATDEQTIRFAEVSLRHEPPTWAETTWRYRQALFHARVIPGRQFANWLERLQSDHPNDLSWPARFTRRRSGEQGTSETLDWPADEWRAPFATQRNAVVGELVPGEGPTFRSFDLGVANHLGLVHRPGWSLPSPEFVVRRQDRRARISAVFVARSAIKAVVEGEDLAGATFEVAGEVPGPSIELDASTPKPVEFDAEALPPQPWLVLHRDGAVLDARLRLERPPLGVAGEWGVTWEAAPEPADNSPFSDEEQELLHAAIIAVKLEIARELPPGPETDELQAILDEADERKSSAGRAEWRKYWYGALVDAAFREAVTWDHVRLVFNMLRATVQVARHSPAGPPSVRARDDSCFVILRSSR